MPMIWASTAAGLSLASTFASTLTMLDLRYRWDVHASSARWLFWLFFLCVAMRCAMRSVFFVWMSLQPASEHVDASDPHSWTYGQLDRLGIHGVQFIPKAKSVWITTIICAGDLSLFGIALTLFPLAYELCRLARIAMDRGVAKEQLQIQRYRRVITNCLAVYAVALIVLVIAFDGYNVYTHRCLLGVYGLQVVALVFMVGQLVLLKMNGRKYETIHGVFVASPVYQRLKLIMLVYALFAFQFQVSMIVIYFSDITPRSAIMGVVGITLILNNSFGLALSITTSCSQTCVFHTFAGCIPEDLEAQVVQHRLAHPANHEDLEAPRSDPVFVYTDIQSSTALWNLNGDVMRAATEIHDDILRSSLLKHRGYEITTVGDAFQVAFRTTRDAIEYCMDVQLQLLVANWPKQLHALEPATAKVRAGRRLLFNGLRVRMGIHDASGEDGRLVQDVHAITGKTTYTGVSEVVAEYVGELGSGGQILLTERVASWLKHHRDELSVDVYMEYVGEFAVPQMGTTVQIYQLQPAMLAARRVHFKNPTRDAGEASTTVDSDLRRELLRGQSTRGLSARWCLQDRGEDTVASDVTTTRTDSLDEDTTTEQPFTLLRSPQAAPVRIDVLAGREKP